MAFLFNAGKTNASAVPKYTQLNVQTSAYGLAIPIVYGANRVASNLAWYANFHAIDINNPSQGGGGGGKGGATGGGGKGGGGSTTTNYYADCLFLICEGPVYGFGAAWQSQTFETAGPASMGFTVLLGEIGAPVWAYLADNYPSQAINYSGFAYAAQASFDMGTSANLPNLNWEIAGFFFGTAPGAYGGNYCFTGGDADPSLVIPDLLTNAQYGLGFPTKRIGQVASNDEQHTVPSSPGPYVITVSQSAGFLYNTNVVDTVVAGLGTNLYTCVGGAPGVLQYSFNPSTGVYYFNSAQAGTLVNIRYASLGPLTNYKNWCLSSGLWVSPAYTDQAQASSMLDDLATATYSEFVWSAGVLTLVPRSAQSVTGNGYTFTAPSTPLFNLGLDDFMPNTNPTGTVSASMNDDPVILTRLRNSDRINDVKIEFLDRANQYAPSIAEATNQALIDRWGRRASAPKSLHMFCDANAANLSAYLQLQDQAIRNNYSIQLDVRYCVLDPMDLVTLTDPDYPGMSSVPARILEITENDDGTLSISLEEYLGTLGNTASYALNVGSGYQQNFNVAPGSVNAPALFAAPIVLAQNQGLEIWCAISGTNPGLYGGCQVWVSSAPGGPYKILGDNFGASRMGVTTGDFPVGRDPDTVNALAVNLSESAGSLESGTSQDADQANTLCLVRGANGDEYVSYETATLTGTNAYSLGTYIRRGQYNTPIVDHPTGSAFVRLDQLIFRIPYTPAQIGQTLYIKFPAFNIWGGGQETLDAVPYYTIVLPEPPLPPDVAGFTAQQNGNVVVFSWNPVNYPLGALAGYYIGYAPAPGAGDPNPPWSEYTMLTEASAGTEMTNAEVPPGNWIFGIRAANIGNTPGTTVGLSADITTATLQVVNQNEAISAIAQAPQWLGTKAGFLQDFRGVLVPLGTKVAAEYSPLGSPPAPALGSTIGGALGARTYYVKQTLVSASGETLASAEATIALSAGHLMVVTAAQSQGVAVGWNLYASTSAGAEDLQNVSPNSFMSNWTEPLTGLVTGADVPTQNTTGWEVFDSFVPDPPALCYYVSPTVDTGYNDSVRVYDTASATSGPLQDGIPDSQLSLLIDTWLTGFSDPMTYVAWTIGFVLMRYLNAMLEMAPVAGDVAYVTNFTPTIDTAPLVQSANNASIAPGGSVITFPTPYHFAPYVVATPVAGTSLKATVSNVTQTGCTINVWNDSGASVGGNVNWIAQGE